MLFKETVEPSTLGLLKELINIPELEQFRLVGGTALSLLFGHRSSIDLDLFTDRPFDREAIVMKLQDTYPSFSYKAVKSSRLFFTSINGVKVDFVNTFEKFYNNFQLIDEIRFASIEDIIALKLNAIAGRGAKKDFWDIREILERYPLKQALEYYQQRYPENDLMMVLKSLTYFADADLDPDPRCFKSLAWEQVKTEIKEKFTNYINTRN